ncbi:MAG: NAD(+)/NADH kinase [Methylotenera sp.]|nr:NAD(+)/NADH kinase [Oligoflexia bacterium]
MAFATEASMGKLRKLAFIGNSKAGKGSGDQLFRMARRSLWGWESEIFQPESAQELFEVCRDLDPDQYEAAVVAGGDGTANWAIRGLMQSGVPLFPFPSGTANDLARQMGVMPDWAQAQTILDRREFTQIDLIEANGVPFATVAGIGIGATLTSHFNEWRIKSQLFTTVSQRLRSQVYTALTLKTIFADSNSEKYIRIQAGSFDEKIKTSAVFICNQSTLGGDMKVAPHAKNSDQKLELLVIPRTSKFGLIHALKKLKESKEKGNSFSKDFILFSTEKVMIQDLRGKTLSVFGDGEILSNSNRVEFKIMPAALNIYRGTRRNAGTQEISE